MVTTQMTPYILIIDDSPTIRAILEMTARREGYAARCFPDGYAALRWLASPEGQIPALIFLDLTMPRMDGFTVLRHFKSKPALAVVPVIVLTSREGRIDQLKARLAGACEYHSKPLPQEAIVAILHQYLTLPIQATLPGPSDQHLYQTQGDRS
ncbi:MAG: response regulator [Ktedonobacteraceae bacterium]